MPRPRYVAFALAGPMPLSRRDVGQALTQAAKRPDAGWTGPPPQLTRYSWPHGIARCEHDQLTALRTLIPTLADLLSNTTLRTLSSSGTLKALTERLGILAERAEPKLARAAAR